MVVSLILVSLKLLFPTYFHSYAFAHTVLTTEDTLKSFGANPEATERSS